MLTSTDRYIARLIAVPLASTLVISAMLLVLDKMLRLFDFVAAQGGPVSVVWRMLANMLPEYLALGIPIGLMLGILLALRRLALSSELDVLRGVGFTPAQLMRVPYMYAAALALVNLAIVGFIQPYSRYAYEGLSYELRSGALGASIKIGEFANLGKGMTLRIEESYDNGRDLRGIFVRVEQKKDQSLAVTAARGTFLATDDPDTIILRLTDGVLVQRSPNLASPRILSFSGHDLPIALPKIETFRSRGNADRELTLPELVRVGAAEKTESKTRNEVLANMNFRLAEVAMMFLLPLAALAFAIPPKRSTSALGVFLSGGSAGNLSALTVARDVARHRRGDRARGRHSGDRDIIGRATACDDCGGRSRRATKHDAGRVESGNGLAEDDREIDGCSGRRVWLSSGLVQGDRRRRSIDGVENGWREEWGLCVEHDRGAGVDTRSIDKAGLGVDRVGQEAIASPSAVLWRQHTNKRVDRRRVGVRIKRGEGRCEQPCQRVEGSVDANFDTERGGPGGGSPPGGLAALKFLSSGPNPSGRATSANTGSGNMTSFPAICIPLLLKRKKSTL